MLRQCSILRLVSSAKTCTVEPEICAKTGRYLKVASGRIMFQRKLPWNCLPLTAVHKEMWEISLPGGPVVKHSFEKSSKVEVRIHCMGENSQSLALALALALARVSGQITLK